MWTGSSAEEFSFKQKTLPSEFETRHPLTTFHSSFISSTVEGSSTGSSDIPLGNLPGDRPIAIGLATGDLSCRLGEYGRLLMTSRGMCVGLACVGK